MPHSHRFALALGTLVALAVPAQADDIARLLEGIDGCYATVGEGGEATHAYMEEYGWGGDADPSAGFGYLSPPDTGNIQITVALDGSLCRVDSATIGSDIAATQLRNALEEAGQEFEFNKDENGCTQLGMGDGYAVTIMSGLKRPPCGAERQSALVFTYN